MAGRRLLILGGTGEASRLAQEVPGGWEVITSLAGRTQNPASAATRVGGFGGVAGLASYLCREQITAVVDATHPFAGQISSQAVAAAHQVGVPLLLLVRPPWQPQVGDRWLEVADHGAAAALLPGLAERVFLTIGRQELAAYAGLAGWFLMRMIEMPRPPLPAGEVILARGPFELGEERSLLQRYQIGAIVSKNSGGQATYAKIVAARELGLPVVMIQRPPLPDAEKVGDVSAVVRWLEGL